MTAGEALFLGVLTGTVVAAAEHFALHVSGPLSILIGVAIAVSSTALNVWLESRRRAREAPPRRSKRR